MTNNRTAAEETEMAGIFADKHGHEHGKKHGPGFLAWRHVYDRWLNGDPRYSKLEGPRAQMEEWKCVGGND